MANGHQPLNGVIGPGNQPYVGPWPSPYQGPSTLNMWQNLNHHWSAPCVDPFYVDLSIGNAYSFTVANTTDNDIEAGIIELWTAEADPTDWCRPGTFVPMEPVAGCTAIVSGVDEGRPVTVTITPEMPIRAHAICKFSAPCPHQFFQIRFTGGAPAGVDAWATISSLKRTNNDQVTPWGFIPRPMDVGIESMMARGGQQQPGQQQLASPQQRGQQPQQQPRQPQPQPQPQQPQPAQRQRNPRPQPGQPPQPR